nr:hypothetical protein [Tanacetum cinerariifolium]
DYGQGVYWGRVMEGRGSSGEWWKWQKNRGDGVAGRGGKSG